MNTTGRSPDFETMDTTGLSPDFETMIRERLVIGERTGSDKYSSRFPHDTGWDKNDYLARLLCDLRYAIVKSINGVFYGMALSENDIDVREEFPT